MRNIKYNLGTPDHYNSVNLKEHTVAELRKEYRQFRNEAKARIQELKNAGYGDSKLLQNKEYLNINPLTMNKQDLVDALSYTESFIHSKLSTLEGQQLQRTRAVEKLKDLGYENITERNINSFGKFMDATKTLVKNNIIGSPDLLELFDKAVANNISIANLTKNITWYLDNIDNIESLDLNTERKKAYTKTQLERIFAKRGI